MTHPLAALIAGVKPVCVYENMDPPRTTVWLDEVLAALEAAPVPDLVEAEEYEARLRREGDGLSVGAADTIRSLITLAATQQVKIDAKQQVVDNEIGWRKEAEAKVEELVARIAGLKRERDEVERLRVALMDLTKAFAQKVDVESEVYRKPYEHPLSAYDRAVEVLATPYKGETK